MIQPAMVLCDEATPLPVFGIAVLGAAKSFNSRTTDTKVLNALDRIAIQDTSNVPTTRPLAGILLRAGDR